MMKLDVSAGKAFKGLDMMVDQVPYAISLGINETLKVAQRSAEHRMDSVFEGGPTAFTKRSTVVKFADKSKPIGWLTHMDKAAGYLAKNETGGVDTPAKAGRRVLMTPIKQRTNAQGNVPRGTVKKVLARRSGSTGDVFVGRPAKGRALGIYQRTKLKKGPRGGKRYGGVKLLFAFSRTKAYEPRYGFRAHAESVVSEQIGTRMQQAMRRAMATRRG